jgi:uncharacterized protein YkwD
MLSKFNIKFKYAGEKLAVGQKIPEEVVTAWMNSPRHWSNILDPVYIEIGVGVVEIGSIGEGQTTYYWVQMFVAR